MKFIKFLSLILIITCAPTLFGMEENVQQQSRVPKLFDLCPPKLSQLIWNQCKDATGDTLNQKLNAINQDIFSKIPGDLVPSIKDYFVKEKGWHVPHCLKDFDNIDWIIFSPDGSLLFVQYRNGRVKLINPKNDHVIKDFNNVNWVTFSPNGSLLFVKYLGDNGNYRGELINPKNGQVIRDNVNNAYFCLDSSLLFVTYLDDNENYRGELIDTKNDKVIKDFNNVSWVEFSPNGSLLFVIYRDGSGKLINPKNGHVIKDFVDNVIAANFFSPNGSLLFVKYLDDNGNSRGELIDTKNGQVITDFNDVDWVEFSPNGSLLFVKNRDELIDTKNGKVIKTFYNVCDAFFTDFQDGSLLFVTYLDDNENYRGELIDTKNDKIIKDFNDVDRVEFSPNGSLLFVWNSKNRGELIDTKNVKVIKTFDNVCDAFFTDSQDGSLLFVCYEDHKGELLTVGSFEQVLFKLALSNTFKIYENLKTKLIKKAVPTDQIKHNLVTLLNHPILGTFPQPAQEKIKEKIKDTLSIDAKRILNKGIITK